MSDVAHSVQFLAALHLLVMGLSHILHPQVWTRFFLLLQRQGTSGSFIHGFITFGFGTLIVAFHDVWTGIPLLLTVLGWLYVLKGTIVFLLPELGRRSLGLVRAERARMFVAPGVVLTSLGLLLGYDLVR